MKLLLGFALSALMLAGAAAPASVSPAERAALQAVSQAESAGRIDAASATADRQEIGRAAYLVKRLPPARSHAVAQCLAQVGALEHKLTAPRALAVFGQLKADDDWFVKRGPPSVQTDVTDADGVVYRYFSGKCFEFHPLATFGALNADVAAGNTDAAGRLAAALVDRAVSEPGGGLGWEYYFNFGGGRAPWLSGMAQAVGAQALAGAAASGDPALMQAATAAYRTIAHGLLTKVSAGPWIRLYAFSTLPVLNAQLQTVISLQSYAQAASDPGAAALAARLEQSAAELLPRFDTGYWSDYSLDGVPSPLNYQTYVAQLLRTLAKTDPQFASAATRFASYLTQPPAFQLANAAVGATRFWLSKPASVHVSTSAGPTRSLSLDAGWHTVSWKLPKQPGIYPVRITATDPAGNTAATDALPIVSAAAAPPTTSAPRATSSARVGTQVAQPSFVVGAGLDQPSQSALASQLGLDAVRLGVAWPAGATAPDPGVVTALQQAPASEGVVVELIANPLPADDPGRTALASYAVSLAQQLPSLRDIVLEPAVTPATAPAYALALGVVHQALQAASSTVALGGALDGSQTPKMGLTALGASAAATGLGSVLDVLAFRPAPAPATGEWTAANLPQLEAALAQAFQAPPPILLDGLASSTAIPAAKAAAYGAPPAAGGVDETAQASAYTSVIESAACDPSIAGVILDRLADAVTPAPTSGIFYADGTPKTSAAAVGQSAVAAERGQIVCPGLQTPAAASTLTFPTALTPPVAPAIVLACVRDCLYLATLERSDGTPVVARRGNLAGGAAPKTIGLPKATLAPGDYQLSVRLVSATNPGTLTLLTSQTLTVQ